MASFVTDIERSVHSKYIKEELLIETKLRQLSLHPTKRTDSEVERLGRERTKEQLRAQKRNRDILKNVELQVARVRSRSLYCPTDGHLEDTKARYIRKLKELREIESVLAVQIHR